MEIAIYEQYKRFVDRVNSGEIPEFYLTKQMPSGITVSHGPPKEAPTGLVARIMGKQAQEKRLERKLREQEVICVAATERGYLYAVNESYQQRPDTTSKIATIKFS